VYQAAAGAAEESEFFGRLRQLCTVTQNEDEGVTQDEDVEPVHSGRVLAG
jgi:hypothetical protein